MTDELPDDSELLRRFAADRSDEQAFAAFVEHRIGFVYASALRRTSGNAHLAEDITQTVFLTASQKAPALARHAHITGWLHTATSHIARTAMRDARLRREREHEAAAMNELLDTPGAATASATQQHMREVLDEALDALAPKDREAVLLRFFEDRDFAEIGSRMKTNEDAARMRVTRALDKLRVLYARRGVTSTAAALTALMTAEAVAAAPVGLATTITGTILAGGGAAIATTTTTVGILAFMSSTKIAIIATAAVLIMATFATLEVRREKAAAADLATLKREHTAFLKNLGDTQKYVKGYQTALTNFHRRKAEADELAKNPQNPLEAGKAFLAVHPEIKTMLVDIRKAVLAGKFYPLYKQLNLTPEQIAEFEDIVSKYMKAGIMTIDKTIPGIGKITLTTQPDIIPYSEAIDKLNDLLGPENTKKMEPYITDDFATELAYNLYYTDTPLTAGQGARLSQIIRTVAENDQNDSGYSSGFWGEMLKQSSAILSEPQMSALKQIRAQNDWWNTFCQMEQEALSDKQSAAATGKGDAQ